VKNSNSKESKIAGHHNDICVSKVNHQEDTINHGITNRNQRIQAAQRETVNKMLCEANCGHI